MDILERLREAAEAVALNPDMATRHGETADLAHDEIRRLREALATVRRILSEQSGFRTEYQEWEDAFTAIDAVMPPNKISHD